MAITGLAVDLALGIRVNSGADAAQMNQEPFLSELATAVLRNGGRAPRRGCGANESGAIPVGIGQLPS